MAYRFTEKGFQSRLERCIKAIDEAMKKVTTLHVKIQPGNSKTGSACFTVSLMPIIDCVNCSGCKYDCYDLRNDCRNTNVINDRARNSAIHKSDPDRFWAEIDMQIKALYVTELRINVGGDLTDADFAYVAELGRKNPKTSILFFTKNYKGINKFLNGNEFPENVHPIMSCWEGMEMDNPHSLPCSHVLWKDGRTTAPEFGAVYCGGNCTECHFNGEGCWTLKQNEHVIFRAH